MALKWQLAIAYRSSGFYIQVITVYFFILRKKTDSSYEVAVVSDNTLTITDHFWAHLGDISISLRHSSLSLGLLSLDLRHFYY
jgi:hypothetical protein